MSSLLPSSDIPPDPSLVITVYDETEPSTVTNKETSHTTFSTTLPALSNITPDQESILNTEPSEPNMDINNSAANPKSKKKHKNKEAFFTFKKQVKNKRRSTFCCIFSLGSLILTIILLLPPFSAQMMNDWKLYNSSAHNICTVKSVKNTDHKTSQSQCYYTYQRSDGHKFSNKCGYEMHETTSCNAQISNDSICYLFQNNNNNCTGTMANASELQRNNNMFVVLLGIGSVFGVISLLSAVYAIVLIRNNGIYCSLNAVKRDDDEVFERMQKYKDYKKDKKRRKKSKKNRSKKKRKYSKRDMSEEFDSILSQFGSSTISELHSSTVQSTTTAMTHSSNMYDY